MIKCLSATLEILVTAVDFFRNTSYYSAMEWKEAENITYPNITVCNSAFFNRTYMKRKRILIIVNLMLIYLLLCSIQSTE